MTRQAREATVQAQTLIAVSALPRAMIWRQQVGLFVPWSERALGHPIRIGVPGQADLGGIVDGRAYQWETKSATGRQSKDQRRWQKWVEDTGGTYVIVRGWEDAVRSIYSDHEEASQWLNHLAQTCPGLSRD